jgi:Ring finger domain
MERNFSNSSVQNHRIHPSAILMKILINRLNSNADLTSSTAIASLAENLSENQFLPKPHRLSNYGFSLISLADPSDQEECPVCRDCICETASKLPCGHFFHMDCIQEWFLSHSTCPVCRNNLDNY